MSLKILIPSLGAAALVISSCAPLTPYRPLTPTGVQPRVLTPAEQEAQAKAAEQKRIEEARAEARRQARQREQERLGGTDPEGSGSGGTTQPDTPSKPDYRRAIPIPGKEGFVFNPFTNNPVDVRGIPSGTLVRDPQDPNKAHKFRVP